jgi:NAD(P)-dependent dehydrogenase (short-subunit alcohol dehydrogenase family)
MISQATVATTDRRPQLTGQSVVVIGGSSGIGLETARRARAEGAEVILTGRNPDHLNEAAHDVGALRTAAFDATDAAALRRFFSDLPAPIDHVMVTAGGPRYGPLLEMSAADVRDALSDHVVLGLEAARSAVGKMQPGGTLLFMGGTGGRRVGHGSGIASAATAVMPPFVAALAMEVAPVRVNLIAAGFVDTPLSASLLGAQLEDRRAELRATLPIGRVVEPSDVAALAVHIMSNTALTGATYDIDGGQQFVWLWRLSDPESGPAARPGRRARAPGRAGLTAAAGQPGGPGAGHPPGTARRAS